MKKTITRALLGSTFAAALTLAGSTGSRAATSADHAAHHPGTTQDATPPANSPGSMTGTMPMGNKPNGMMGGNMMSMMAGMMPLMSGMMSSHVEGRLAFLKTELKIAGAQEPQWDRFADAYRAAGQPMKAMQGSMMGMMQGDLPSRLALHQKMLSAHLDALKSISAPLNALYAVLSDEQKKAADDLLGRGGM